MRWLKHTLFVVLLVVAGGVALATLFSDHSKEYGTVALPSGGTVHLPKGKVTVFYSVDGTVSADQQSGGLAFQAIPVAGGPPVGMSSAGGSISAEGTQRSEVIGEHGAIAKLDVPADGEYRIVAATDLPPGVASLDFGTDVATALAAKWKLLAGLVGAAFLVSLIPVPRSRRRDPASSSSASTSTEWSSTPRAPYAG
jgi:hypothetical protein